MSARAGDGGEHAGHAGGVALPLRLLLAQRAAAGGGEAVELRALALLGVPPHALHPRALLEAVQRGVERTVEHAEGLAGALADPARDAVAVARAPRQRLEDQHVERAEQDVEVVLARGAHGEASIPSAA